MRASTLSRSMIAIAALAIGTGALTIVPADAATPSGVTKELAMTAIGYTPSPGGASDSPEALSATRDILVRSCDLSADEVVEDFVGDRAASRAVVDAMIAAAIIVDTDADYVRTCVVGVTVATFADRQLTGTGSLSLDISAGSASAPTRTTVQSALSGDVSVTSFSVPASDDIQQAMFSASGSSLSQVVTQGTTSVHKTKAQKKAAKKARDKKLAAAKKKFVKALKKAGSSKPKKSKAKIAYTRKKAAARAAYSKAIATTTIPTTRVRTVSRPFAVTTPWV